MLYIPLLRSFVVMEVQKTYCLSIMADKMNNQVYNGDRNDVQQVLPV